MRSKVAVTTFIAVVGFSPVVFGYGESFGTFPNWDERVIHQLINRARVDPQTDLANCTGCSNAEKQPTCYTPVAPLAWNFGLNEAARFHSESMGRNNFFSHNTSFTVRNDIAAVYPELCNGSAACASSGPGSTSPNTRVPLFGASYSGEIIAAGYNDSHDAFYGWLLEPVDPGAPCAFYNPSPDNTNGHRWIILKNAGPAVGTGFSFVPGSPYGTYYTGDFGGSGTVVPKIPSGTHWGALGSDNPERRQASSIEFWANWFAAAPPSRATVVVDGVEHVLSLRRGIATNGAWSVTLGGLGTGCHRYYFLFEDASGQVRYPTFGTLGVGPQGTCADWAPPPRSDFNADEKSDILLHNMSNGDIAQWQMNAEVITAGAVVGNPGPNYAPVTVGDYNGDGRADIALQNSSTGDIAVWLMNGFTIISGNVVGNPGPGWRAVNSGDLNADNRDDIILYNSGNGNVAGWLMNGGTIQAGAVIGTPGVNWTVSGAGDFNRDTHADILLQNTVTHELAQWQMNGLSILAARSLGSPGTGWIAKGVGDASGDGFADIILRHNVSADIAEWQMNGFTLVAGAVLGNPGSNYDVIGTADYNGDDHYDVLLRNPAGSIAEWMLNGFTIIRGAVVGNPGSNWMPILE